MMTITENNAVRINERFMLTKATAKLIQSLKDKRARQESGLFVVEGTKTVTELPASKIKVKSLFATSSWISANESLFPAHTEIVEVSETQLRQLSFQQSPQHVLALAEIPFARFDAQEVLSGFVLALDTVQDPGNLGTIIRIADWYGITDILCSEGCADVYNPKVIQATMGSFMRVRLHYTSLEELFETYRPVVAGAVMNGENLHKVKLPHKGVLLIGNEGAGIGIGLLPYITRPVTIPRFGGAESLNAGVATAIICDAWARQHAG
jgi:TrmH family RNA methyltransferase